MSGKDELHRARRALEDAVSTLRYIHSTDAHAQAQVQRALGQLGDAERYLKRGAEEAGRELRRARSPS